MLFFCASNFLKMILICIRHQIFENIGYQLHLSLDWDFSYEDSFHFTVKVALHLRWLTTENFQNYETMKGGCMPNENKLKTQKQ